MFPQNDFSSIGISISHWTAKAFFLNTIKPHENTRNFIQLDGDNDKIKKMFFCMKHKLYDAFGSFLGVNSQRY